MLKKQIGLVENIDEYTSFAYLLTSNLLNERYSKYIFKWHA